jgi:RNA polymerase sigma-70 factor (ECF subfamily)
MFTDTSQSLLDRLKSYSTTQDWAMFVEIYHPFISDHFRRCQVPESDIDDLCQETLAQVFKGLAGFDHNGRVGAFRNWLKKIIRQRMWQYFKTRNVHGKTSEYLNCAQDSRHAEFDQRWDHEHDQFVVNRLLALIRKEFTSTSWESFRLTVVEGKTPAVVAESLCVSVNAVLISKSRILKRLRQLGRGLIETFGN